MTTDFFYSDKTLATRYQVSRATVWRWTQEGKLPQPVKINGSTRWRSNDIEAFEGQSVKAGVL